MKTGEILHKLQAYKYPLLLLLLGVMLLLLPGGIRSPTASETVGEEAFTQLLNRAEGVGDCVLVLSEEGAVIVCEGADDPQVRLSLIQALRSYTGFASDRITILKMAGKG